MNYKEKLEKMVADLKNNPKVDIVEIKINQSIDEQTLQDLLANHQKNYKIDFPQSFIDFYKQMNGFKLVWKPKEKTLVKQDGEEEYWDMDTCYTEFLPLQNVCVNYADEVWWNEEENELQMAFQFYIDYKQEEQGTWFLGIDGKLGLYYIDNQGEDVRAIQLDFEHFFELFLASRGFFCWQEVILPKVQGLQDFVFEVFHNWMPVLFIDFKPEIFKRPENHY